ncbi:MAG: AraC family transcriptional regulator [Acidimicrobiales bacterium]
MDALTGLLGPPSPHEPYLLRAVMEPPWAIVIEDEAPLSLVAITSGSVWLTPEGEDPVRLARGDIVLVRGDAPYRMGDAPDTAPFATVLPGNACQTLDGTDLAQSLRYGVRSWGNAERGSTTMLIGNYEHVTAVGQHLLRGLPRHLVLSADTLDSPLIELLGHEIDKDQPGQQAVLARLLDLLVVAVIRAWLAQSTEPSTRWFRARADPIVGDALRLIHDAPAHPWTVASLAAQCGASRAALARRFTDLVGEPPLTYLTAWRLAMAADLLDRPGSTLAGVAQQVGYGSPFALSAAFKRVRGVSPAEHRRREAALRGGPGPAEAASPPAPRHPAVASP